MFSEEVSRFLRLVVSAVLGILFLAASGYARTESVITALLIGAGALFLYAFVTIWMVGLSAYDYHISTWENFASTFGKLDDEARAAMAFAFPKLRYTMKRGQIREMFEDTNVPIEVFRLFLQTSNDRYISPRRDWYTIDKPEWAWMEIKDWLEERGYIVPDSAAGAHSWLWSGGAYQRLYAYWMAGRKLVDLGRTGEAAVYAQDEQVPELEPES